MTTRIKGPLPDVDLASFVTLTVDAGDPNAVITGWTIHIRQDVPALPEPTATLPELVTYGPPASGNV